MIDPGRWPFLMAMLYNDNGFDMLYVLLASVARDSQRPSGRQIKANYLFLSNGLGNHVSLNSVSLLTF